MGLAAFAVPAIATFSTSGIAAWAGSNRVQAEVTTTMGQGGVTTTRGEVTTTRGEVTTTMGEVTTTMGEVTTTTTKASVEPSVAAKAVSAKPTYTG